MRTDRLVRIALRSLVKNKMRAALTMLGVIIGVGAVIIMVAIGDGARSVIEEQIADLGTNLLVVTPGSTTVGGARQGAGSSSRLTVDDALFLERESTLLANVSPVIATFTQIVGGNGNWRAPINGVDFDYVDIRDWSIESGRGFESSDLTGKRKVAILGHTVAEQLFPDEDPIGAQVRLRNVPFEVIGVLSEKGQTAEGSDQDDIVLAPYTTVQTRLAGRQFVAQILGSAFSTEDIAAAQEEVRRLVRESHQLSSWEDDDFTVRNQTQIAETAAGATETMTVLLASIAGISLLVGGIGIMNIMLVSVTERTREIGLRMALGARGGDVLRQFLIESLVLSAMGGLLGLGLGGLGSVVVSHFTGWPVAISPTTAAIAMIFAGIVGVGFGYYPARKAAALDPIVALRFD